MRAGGEVREMEDTQLILNAIYDLKCFCLAIYFMIILTCPSKLGFPLNAILALMAGGYWYYLLTMSLP